ncbi:MAG: mechanosensitive ion channel family protein [Chloroflexi bacterium]|nr:mechanosensitive ion channel family protein [Chloroflexota bacterium]
MHFLEPWLQELGLVAQAWHPVIAFSIFLTGAVFAFLFHTVIYPVVLRFTNFTPTNLDVSLLQAFRRPLTLGILVGGLYLSLVLTFDFTLTVRHAIDRAAGLIGLVLGVFAASGLVSALFNWYYDEISPHTPTTLDDRIIPMLRRIGMGLVYALGGLLVLDLLNVNISPILASLGLGGLAVALALQPTLSNLFAGTYVMTEGVVSQGDYIELENNVAGYVIDVGWRSTRLRTWTNNLVVVPNSRFAETIITNFQGPIPAVNIYLTCGVSYDSDLVRVEQVCREEMDRLLESDPRAVKDYGAYFAYESFDDSNITFYLFIQARDRIASFEVQSELIRMVHQRFLEENIVINYPMRTINFAGEPVSGMSAQANAGSGQPGPQRAVAYRAQGTAPVGSGGQEAPASSVAHAEGPDGPDAPGPDFG